MMDYLAEYGYAGLFLASFLAATILPLSSEVVLTFLLLNDYNPVLSVSIATAGNVLGAFTNYFIGLCGGVFLIKRLLRISDNDFFNAKQRLNKYGVASLFFAWVPVIGDPLTFAAGVLKINIFIFLVLVTAGKMMRYIVLGFAIL